jgi:hypothetical protein
VSNKVSGTPHARGGYNSGQSDVRTRSTAPLRRKGIPDKAEVSGSSPLRPTVEHLVTGKSVLWLPTMARPA